MTAKQAKKHKYAAVALKQQSLNSSQFFLPLIIIITAALFLNTLGHDFITNLDDGAYILKNEFIRSLNWRNLKIIFSTFYHGNYFPLTLLSYAIEFKLFGLNPFTFHLTNYILHLFNVLLVFLFMKRFIGKDWVAAITALFFAVHPMHVESVAWISERKDVLYTFFFLLSINAYSTYLAAGKKKSYITWSFLWFFMSLMSKSAAVCLPLVLMLMDFYHHKFFSWKSFISKIPFFLLSLLFGITAVFSQKSSASIQDISPLFSIFDRIFLVGYAAIYYLFKAFAPFHLSAMHYYPVKSGSMLPMEYYLSLPALLLLIWGVLKSGRFKHELIFGLLFYFITIVLVLQILPVGQAIVAERYSYVPYIGIFFIVGQFFSYVKEKELFFSNAVKSVLFFILVVLFLLFSSLTYERNKVWKNGEVLFLDIIDKYPKQGYSWYALGNYRGEKKDYMAAMHDYNKSELLGYNIYDLYYNRGVLKDNLGDFDGALVDYHKAIKLNSKFAGVYYNCGNVYYKMGKYADAIGDYSKELELNPYDTMAYYGRGVAKTKLEDFTGAIADLNKAIELKPDVPDFYMDRAVAKHKLKDYPGALADGNEVLKYSPNDPDGLFNRGVTKFYLNDKNGACKDWLSAQQYGNAKAGATLEQYCKN